MSNESVVNALKGLDAYKRRKNFIDIEDIAKAAVEHAKQYSDKEEQAYECVKYAMKRILND